MSVLRRSGFVFLLVLIMMLPYVAARAESTIWNSTEKVQLCSDGYASDCVTRFSNPSVSVQYAADIINASTGDPLACGSTVPLGTEIKLQFRPRSSTDISWFTVGYTMDSPYGVWSSDISEPKAALCTEPNFISKSDYYQSYNNVYGLLRIALPNAHVDSGGLHCSGGEGTSLDCTADKPGSFSPTFVFDETEGRFWADYYNHGWTTGGASHCDSMNQLMTTYVGAYDGQWGAESQATYAGSEYSCPNPYRCLFTGQRAPYVLQVPAQSISCPINVAAVGTPPNTPTLKFTGACTVGAPLSVSMTSTDPDGDNLKYGVDWDGNGSVDQWVPPSGYVPSGVLQTASRTYAIAGSKTVKALAQDQNGNTSGWASLTFTCSGSTTVAINEGDTGGGNDGGNGNLGQLLPDLDLRVIPSLVRSGNTTKVNWSSVNARSCTVQGQNGDSWSGLLSPLGGQVSKSITTETTYTLTCLTDSGSLTKTATVRIIPTFQEK